MNFSAWRDDSMTNLNCNALITDNIHLCYVRQCHEAKLFLCYNDSFDKEYYLFLILFTILYSKKKFKSFLSSKNLNYSNSILSPLERRHKFLLIPLTVHAYPHLIIEPPLLLVRKPYHEPLAA